MTTKNRYMNFSEILNFNFGAEDTNKIFSRQNIELIENTPEEIRAVTIEMDDRLKGIWKTSGEDEDLQKRFWTLFSPDKQTNPAWRIGTEFLRQNQALIK